VLDGAKRNESKSQVVLFDAPDSIRLTTNILGNLSTFVKAYVKTYLTAAFKSEKQVNAVLQPVSSSSILPFNSPYIGISL